MKFIHLGIMVLFILFAYWQMNDPDAMGWIVLYVGVAFCAVQYFAGKKTSLVPVAGFAACFFGILLLIPDFISWMKMGMPTITGSMKAEAPHIELVREFFGFFLAGLAYGWYFKLSDKQEEH